MSDRSEGSGVPRTMRGLILFVAFCNLSLIAQVSSSTAHHIFWGASLPPNCNPNTGDVFARTSDHTYWMCTASNTWTQIGSAGGSGTVSAGTAGQVAYYAANGTTVSGESPVPVSQGGTGLVTIGAQQLMLGAGTGPISTTGFTFPTSVTADQSFVSTGSSTVAATSLPNSPNGLSYSTSTHLFSALSAPATQLHSVSFVIDGGGSVISTGDAKVYPTADFACTINRIDISADQSGSATVDVWKAAGAIPTSGNKISASAPLTLSSAQLAQNGLLAGWTLTVSVGDVFGFNVATATTVTRIVGQIWCQ